MTSLPAASRDYERLCRDLGEHGYCLVHEALAPDLLARVRERLIEQAREERARSIEYTNPGHLDNQWVNMLINKGTVFEALVLHGLASRLVSHHLGEHYLLSCCDAQIKHPGATAMALHTDQWWMPPPAVPGESHVRPADMQRAGRGELDPAAPAGPITPPAVCNVMWMVTEFTRDNGATVVVPGSQHSGHQPDASIPHRIDTVAAEGEAGTAIVFDGRLWHAAGANVTDETRYGITCTYCGPQFRPLENYTLGLRPQVAETCSPELLRRLGYRAWSTYGHTGDPDLEQSLPGTRTIGRLPT